MQIQAQKTGLQAILPLRALFLQENNFQARYHACHERGWSDSYLLTSGDLPIGYGAVKGMDGLADRDAVFEFYILPAYRRHASNAFHQLLKISAAKFIECQSNDPLLSFLLYEFAHDITSDVILFSDGTTTDMKQEGLVFRKRSDSDRVFAHTTEPEGDYVLAWQHEIVATGGFALHYNHPFADLYMEVREDCRRKGWGCFLIQELKRECYLAGRVPAARCHMQNRASRYTLLKAGMKIAGCMVKGRIKNWNWS